MRNKTTEFLINFIVTAFILSACFTVLDLYDPIKQLLLGKYDSRIDLTTYMNLKKYLPAILGASVALAIGRPVRYWRTKNGQKQ